MSLKWVLKATPMIEGEEIVTAMPVSHPSIQLFEDDYGFYCSRVSIFLK